MSSTTLVVCVLAVGLIFAVFYALRRGYDVKAALKIAFIGVTFEAKDKRLRNPTKPDAPGA